MVTSIQVDVHGKHHLQHHQLFLHVVSFTPPVMIEEGGGYRGKLSRHHAISEE